MLGRGNEEEGEGEEGEEVGGLEESDARQSRRWHLEVVLSLEATSAASSESMEAKWEWEMAESGRMKTVVMHVMSKAPSVREISGNSMNGDVGDAETEIFWGGRMLGTCWRLAFLWGANVVGPTTSIPVFTHVETGSPGHSLRSPYQRLTCRQA
jgi:hypothetical protein